MFLTSDIIFNTHNTRSRTIWMEKKIAFNQILSEKKKSVSLPLLHHWRWFPRMIVLLIFLYWQTEFCFVHTYINSPETTSWYHHHHKKMTRCQVSTFKSVKKIWYSLCSVESIFMLISTCSEQEKAKRSPEAVENWKKIF